VGHDRGPGFAGAEAVSAAAALVDPLLEQQSPTFAEVISTLPVGGWDDMAVMLGRIWARLATWIERPHPVPIPGHEYCNERNPCARRAQAAAAPRPGLTIALATNVCVDLVVPAADVLPALPALPAGAAGDRAFLATPADAAAAFAHHAAAGAAGERSSAPAVMAAPNSPSPTAVASPANQMRSPTGWASLARALAWPGSAWE
jgi:hypothetical protein